MSISVLWTWIVLRKILPSHLSRLVRNCKVTWLRLIDLIQGKVTVMETGLMSEHIKFACGDFFAHAASSSAKLDFHVGGSVIGGC